MWVLSELRSEFQLGSHSLLAATRGLPSILEAAQPSLPCGLLTGLLVAWQLTSSNPVGEFLRPVCQDQILYNTSVGNYPISFGIFYHLEAVLSPASTQQEGTIQVSLPVAHLMVCLPLDSFKVRHGGVTIGCLPYQQQET